MSPRNDVDERIACQSGVATVLRDHWKQPLSVCFCNNSLCPGVACRHKCQAVDPIFQMCFNRPSSSFPARSEVVTKFKCLGRDPVSLAEQFLALRRVLVLSSLWSVSPRRTKLKALRFFETSVNTLTASLVTFQKTRLVIFPYKIVSTTDAQIRCSRSPWPVCLVPQYGTCFNSPFWRPEV